MGRLNQGHRQSRANRPQGGNLSELGGDGLLATLRQQFAARLLAQVLQHVQLLIESLGSPAAEGQGSCSSQSEERTPPGTVLSTY